ncbi:type II toxin-antitoxin system RelE/ParE family toxin [Methylomicrobium sp. RS1]|uniref:type II toxin-antitoxin system RelE/ParE family toxin n=1 Tax=Candidatus Methylomicrobium oryzae TaxID=2802053 RepID=UPI0019240674|nr:type II toxin-antitoxin system RelE/ParE family toxin [Methylomicrobium sp. RS1]
MNILFHPDAELEFNEAIDYYENAETGLGLDFSIEIANAIERIAAFPKAWPLLEDGIRRSLVRRFPYGVLYHESQRTIYVVAVMHLHRNPDYWQHRIKN